MFAFSAQAQAVKHAGVNLGLPSTGGGSGGPFTFVASASGGEDSSGSTVATSSTLNVVTGDVLLTMVSFEDGSGTETVEVTDNGNVNPHTFTSGDDAHETTNLTSVYPLFVTSAATNSAATFTATIKISGVATNRSFKRIIVMQYRPATGATVTKDITGTRESTGNGSTITTGSFSTSGTYTIVCAMQAIYTSGSHSNSTIAGVAAEQTKTQQGAYQWCRTAGAITTQTASTTYSAVRQWSATVLALKSVGGTYVDLVPPADPTDLNGTAGNAQVSLTWSHSNTSDVDHYIVQYDCGSGYVDWSPNPTTTSVTVTGLTNDVSCNFKVSAVDAANNTSEYSGQINRTPTASPVRSAGAPTGTLASGTTSTTISLTTNVSATCKYSTTAGTAYASMANTFSTTGGTSHSTTVSGLSDGNTYHYYVRCTDGSNPNITDYDITFFVLAPVVSNCTDGVNCYCDSAAYTGDTLGLGCEDFEDPGYYLNTSNDWAEATSGDPTNRGSDSSWTIRYGSFQGSQWKSTDPTPRVPPTCGYSICSGAKGDYCSADQGNLVDGAGSDCWGPGINSGACIDIQRGNDVFAENGSLTLTGGTGTNASIGAGNAHFAERIAPSNTCGFTGTFTFPRNVTEVGITQMIALSSNMFTMSVSPYDGPFKHHEWSGNGDSNGSEEHWYMGKIGAGGTSQNPYRPVIFTGSKANCDAMIASATVHVGYPHSAPAFVCPSGDVKALYAADETLFSQATDFPAGQWTCQRAWFSGMGTTNAEMKIWHMNPAGTERLIFHASGMDGTYLVNQYYRRFKYDSYTNLNDSGQSSTPTTETAFRYNDNIHVREGVPVSCATIGFAP